MIIRAGENIQSTAGGYVNNILLLGAASGTRLSIADAVGLYVNGILNSDDTTLSQNLITTGTSANINFIGSGRQVIGNHWSGDVTGWTVNFSVGDTARVLTDFKAGTIGINGPTKFGTYDAPTDLFADGGSENSGSLSVNGTYLFVSGNITRNKSYTSRFNNFTASWSTIELGGTYLSAEQIKIGWPDYWYAITNTLRIRSTSGLLISSSSYGHMGTLEYIGTSAQTSGNELIGISNINIKNPNGVQLLNSVSITNLYLDTGNVSLPSDITLSATNLYAKGYSILGTGNVSISERVETAHANGLPGVFQNTGTTSLTNWAETVVFNGTTAQQSGTLRSYFKDFPTQYISFTVNNPAGVTFNGSYAGNTLTLTNGNLTVNSPDTLTFNTLTAGTSEIHGTGMYIQKMGSLTTAHPNGIDGTIQTTNYAFDAPANGGMTFHGVLPQSTGMRMPDSLGGLTIQNSSGFTFSKSIFLPSFDLNAQACDLTLPIGNTFRTGTFYGGTTRKISGGGNFTLNKGGYLSTSNPAGINGMLQLTGEINLGDSAVIAFVEGGTPLITGTMLPDTVQSIYFSNSSGTTVSKPFNVRTIMSVQNGAVDNSVNNISLWEGATLHRNSNGSITATPKFQNYYDVNYGGWAGNSGPEIPDSTTVLRNLLGANWITLTKNATVNGTIQNHVRTDSFTVRALGPISSSYMIVGHLSRFVSSPKQYTWEVADKDAQRFHPFSLNVTSMNDSGDVTVTLYDTAVAPIASLPPEHKVLRYYYKAEQNNISGLSAVATLVYNDGDVIAAGIPDDDSLQVMQWKNNTWQNVNIVTRDNKYNNTITVGPIDTLTTFIITGTEKKGIAELSVKEINFGDVIRPEFKYDSLYIKNIGTWPLQISSISNTPDPWTFGATLSSMTIPVGDSVKCDVWINAYHGGTETKIFFNHNGTTGVDTLILKGKAVYPNLSYSTWNPSFGTVPVGDSKLDSVMLYNTGTYKLIITELVSGSPHFTVKAERDTILPTDSAKLYITFAPQVEGSFSEWITIRNSIVGSGDGYRIYPNGIATASQFAVLPTELTFGTVHRGESKKDSVQIKNPGAAVLHVTNVYASVAGYTPSPTSFDVASGDSTWVTVTFAPQSQGEFNGELIFNHSAMTTSPDSVHISGTGTEQIFSADKSSFTFGSVTVGNTRTDSLMVTNQGNIALNITSVIVSDSSQFFVSPKSAQIAAGEKQKFYFAFKPVLMGTQNGTVKFTHDGIPDTNIVSVSGFGQVPVFTASRRVVDFGEVRIDSTRKDTIVITNTGNTSLAVTSITSSDSEFVITPQSVILSSGSKKEFTVAFSPRRPEGYKEARFVFSHNGSPTTDTLRFSGQAVEPIFFADASVSFTSVRKGKTGTDTLTVHNNGSMPLTISSAVLETDTFSVAPGNAVIPKNSSAKFAVTFAPTARGHFSDRIIFTHDGRKHFDTVAVQGLSIEPLFNPHATNFHFDSVRVNRQKKDSVWIRNNGNTSLAISSIVSGDAQVTMTPSSLVLAAGDSSKFMITMTPAQRGTVNAKLIVTHDADSNPDTLFADGVGVEPLFSASASSLNFGDVRVDSTKIDSIIVTNPGNMDLLMVAQRPSNQAYIIHPETTAVFKGSSRTIYVSFTPNAQTIFPSKLKFFSTADSSPDSVGLTGRGIAPVFALKNSLIDFGGVRIGNKRMDSVCVKNSGSAPLAIHTVRSSDSLSFTVTPGHAVIAPADSFWFRILYSAGERTEHTARIEFVHDARSGTDTLDVKGHGILPEFVASSQQVHFGELRLGHSATDSVEISNPGNSPLIVSSVSVTDSQFTVQPGSFTVQPNGKQKLHILFNPKQRKILTASLIFAHNAEPSLDSITLSGTGVEPLFVSSKQLLNFGSVRTDSMKIDSVEISNPGNMDLKISHVHSQYPAFTVMPESTIIGSGASQNFIITFDPAIQGTITSTVKFISDASSSPDSIIAKGTGIVPIFTANRSGINFGGVAVGNTRTDSMVVKNIGTAPLFIRSANSADSVRFTVEPKQMVIAPADSQSFRITYHSTEMAEHSSTVEFLHDGISKRDTVNVTGHGLMPLFVSSSRAVEFGEVRIGTVRRDSLEISNAGNSPLFITSVISKDSQFAVSPDPFTVPPGEMRRLQLKFIPDHRGAASSKIVISHNAVQNSDTISISGTGVEPLFLTKRTQIDFGMMEKDSLRTDTVEIVNRGNAALLIDSISTFNGITSVTPKNASIAKGDSLRFAVTIHPRQTGTLKGFIKFRHNAPAAPDTVFYSVNVGPPVFTLNRHEVKFRTTMAGKKRTDTLKIFNEGFFDLNITSVSVSDSSFVVTMPAQTVKGQSVLSAAVTFSPKSAGVKSGMLIFTHNTRRQSDTVIVSGKGVELTTIAQARLLTNGSEAVIEGTVTRTKGTLSFVQDSTAALSILPSQQWWSDSLKSGGIAAGDVVRIGGVVTESNFLKQIAVNDSIEFVRVARNTVMPKAAAVNLAQLKKNGEQFESRIVSLKAVSITNTTDTAFVPLTSYSIVDAADSTQSVVLRIGAADQTDIDGRKLPKKNFNFTGVVTQFHLSDSSKGYQLLPLSNSDLESDPTIVQEWAIGVPTEYILYNNFPNPFNPSTTIRFGVPEASSVRIEVFDILGRRVKELFNDRMDAGYQQIVWHASVATGVYLYRIESRSVSDPKKVFVNVKKMMLLK
ncbi:MAG: choice-of-anchor D domain-containing protein [Bacteroidota bacterium]